MAEDLLSTPTQDTGGESRLMRLPKKSIQSEYLLSTLMVIRTFDIMLGDLKRIDDPRPTILARQIINRVLDDEIRFKLLDAYDAKLAEATKAQGSADDRAAQKIRIAQDFVGEVNGYMDEFFALHKGQEIGDV